MDAQLPFPELSELLPTTPVSGLARACIDLAYDVIRRQPWLDDQGVTCVYGEISIVRDKLNLECLRVEREKRGLPRILRDAYPRRVAATQH
jgi:hypothetical protein